MKLIQSEGWKVDPPVESLPESIQDEVRETIEGEKPRRLISKNIDMAMKKAWEILKMPKPYRGPDIRNEAQYEAASLEDRRGWHISQVTAYRKRLSVLRTQHTVDLTDTENPIYQEMQEYQRLRNFHARQEARLGRCIQRNQTECNDYYSAESEGDNRRKQKLNTTPTGKLDPYVVLSLEAYNNLTKKQKYAYHTSMVNYEGQDKTFHRRMRSRLEKNSNFPTFPSPEHGGEPSFKRRADYTKEQYINMNNTDKRKFHARMEGRLRTKGNDVDLYKFHARMKSRLDRNANLPTFYSPEHEQEESQ